MKLSSVEIADWSHVQPHYVYKKKNVDAKTKGTGEAQGALSFSETGEKYLLATHGDAPFLSTCAPFYKCLAII